MEPLAILHADLLDLLFENRNKLYGAYPLRKYYPQRLFISMGVVLFLVATCSFFYLHFRTGLVYKKVYDFPDSYIQTVEILPREKPVLPAVKPAHSRPPASVQYVTPEIVANQAAPKPMATVDDLQANAVGLKTLAGEPDASESQNNSNTSTGAAIQESDADENKREILDRADVMPEFPGGIEALKRFLLKNLRMPGDNNLEPGIRVQVIARFVVDADGRVRDIEITQPADGVFNSEVKRVISKMPDWKPGEQNHRHVAVYFSLPVSFVGAD
jgi:protein TonB